MSGKTTATQAQRRAEEKAPVSGKKVLLLAIGAVVLIALLFHIPIFAEMAGRRRGSFEDAALIPYGCTAEDISGVDVHFREEGEDGSVEHLTFRSEDPVAFAPILGHLLALDVNSVAPNRLYSREPPGRPVWADILSAHLPFGIGERLLPEKESAEEYSDRIVSLYFPGDVYRMNVQFADPYHFRLDVQYRSAERADESMVFQSERPIDLDFIRSFLQLE